ncbi:TAF6-like protein [Xylariaceae sp. FL0804]|nr:TAF6-like protein [Xylariaceae sp. FL0804]
MAANRDARGSSGDAGSKTPALETRLLWNPDNVRDVAESVGVAALSEEALRTLSQDVEYRIGQVLVEALRFMRLAKRTNMITSDVALALRDLNVEPLYGYDTTRSLRYGEASFGPGQPLYYIEDEEVDMDKIINAPLPKVPRDTFGTRHWLAIEGVQPAITQNPTSAESRSQDLLPRGPGANPTLAAVAGHDNPNFQPAVKHIISKELTLFFEKVQAALLDDNPDPEVGRLRDAALAAISADPGIQQLVPYFVTFISSEVTHHLDDTFVLWQVMSLTHSLISNGSLHLDHYATSLTAPVLTCLMARKLGSSSSSSDNSSGGGGTGTDAVKDQYRLREYSATLIGQIALKFSAANKALRPTITRSCLKTFLKRNMAPQVWFGAVLGILAAGGPEAVKLLVLPHLKEFERGMLAPLREKAAAGNGGQGQGGAEAARTELEAVVGAILKATLSLAPNDDGGDAVMTDGGANVNGGGDISQQETERVKEFLGDLVGERVVQLGNHKLNLAVLDAKNFI